MATAKQQAFATTYGPYAQQAGAKLGVDPNIVLGQWGIETGWSTPASGNLAGISPGGKLATYSSPQAFTDAYVGTIQRNFPGAMNTGSDASAFNNGLVNGSHGVYYQGNDAASKGLSTPTQADQNAYRSSLENAQNANLVQYSSGEAPTSSSTLGNTGNTGGQGYGSNPAQVVTTSSDTRYFTVLDANGNPTGSVVSGTTDDPATNYLSPGERLGPEYYYGTGGTSTGGGTSTTTSTGTGSSTKTTTTTGTGGAGTPITVGLQSPTVSTIGGWISGIESAVGDWMTGLAKGAFLALVSWFARFWLVMLALLLILIALWRLLDPDGEKTKAMIKEAAVAA